MKLHFYRPELGLSNFGDELNIPIWNYFFPDLIGKDNTIIFFGIGTVVRAIKKYDNNCKVIVFGSGYHSFDAYEKPRNCEFIFVRGPLSAKVLQLGDRFITDPALLTPIVFPKERSIKYKYAYMPHFSNVANYSKTFFSKLGFLYIDPTDSIENILEQLNSVEIVFAEAMHAAIVADAYGVKWVPVKCKGYFNEFKWNDWALSLNLKIDFIEVPKLRQSDNIIKKGIKFLVYFSKLKLFISPNLSLEEVRIKKTKLLKEKIEEFKNKYK